MAAITLIGSGHTATAVGKALKAAGHQIIQVWSRDQNNAEQLAKHLTASFTTILSEVTGDADIYIVAVKDDAIDEIASELKVSGKIIAHTSGIKSKDLLQSAGGNFGVFYPFVSMTKEVDIDFKPALIMIEGDCQASADALSSLARTISDNVRIVQEGQRQSLHLAAVFANNFSNHMYTIAEQLLKDKGLSFDDLRPLIASHLQNILRYEPSDLQTGPAVRGDASTIHIHQELLAGYDYPGKIYSLLTASIQDFSKKK